MYPRNHHPPTPPAPPPPGSGAHNPWGQSYGVDQIPPGSYSCFDRIGPGALVGAYNHRRQHESPGPNGPKRQRVDSPVRQQRGGQPGPLLRNPVQAVARTSPTAPSGSTSSSPNTPPQVPTTSGSASTLQDYAKDTLSKQMVQLFEACQQQAPDLSRKEMCRSRLQADIQGVFPVARLYLTGSSMSGLGCRTSDADLCLVLRALATQRGPDPIHILTMLQAMFRQLGYLEGIQLIRAKVPILRFGRGQLTCGSGPSSWR
ncbi:hypothetical protein CRUP_029914 [Coryphaenoides rupestris]|nr:hypothetical protein CRUP_029914 [Coryphaenoides rupestris]